MEEEEFNGFSDAETELDQVKHQRVLNIFAEEVEKRNSRDLVMFKQNLIKLNLKEC